MSGVINIILTIFFAIVGFGVLVFIHEFGHMIAGIATGIGVEEFSIGFGPALIKKRIKGILFKISAVPFGGYCKFKGQEDFGTDQQANEPDDFYSRPAWARLITVISGPLANMLFAIILFTIVFMVPQNVITTRTIMVNPNYINEVDFESGDEIIAINNKEIKYGYQIEQVKINKFDENISFTVLRQGEKLAVNYTPNFKHIEQGIQVISLANTPTPVINSIVKGYPAENSGLEKGDKILKINNIKVNYENTIPLLIDKVEENEEISITIERQGEIKTFSLKPAIENGNKLIGITYSNLVNPEIVVLRFSIGTAFVEAIKESYNSIKMTIKGLGRLFSGDADIAKNVSGPIGIFGIVGTVGASQDFLQYIRLIALISVLLGFFNLLPIPAVDGGHIILNIIEIIIRRPINIKVIQVIQIIGVVLILTLFIVVTIKDIINLPQLLEMFKN